MTRKRVLIASSCAAALLAGVGALMAIPQEADASSKCWREIVVDCTNPPNDKVKYWVGANFYAYTNKNGKKKSGLLKEWQAHANVCGGVDRQKLGFHAKKDACDAEIILKYNIYKYRPNKLDGKGTTYKQIKRLYKQTNREPKNGDAIYFAPNTGTPRPAEKKIPEVPQPY